VVTREGSILWRLVEVNGKIVLAAALVAILLPVIFSVPVQSGSAKIVLWDYSYDGENLQITVKNTGDNQTDVLVSLRDENSILIGDPFYYVLSSMFAGNTGTATFTLQEELSTVRVVFEYAEQEETETIHPSAPTPTTYDLSISSSTRWLEADLGGSASYSITLNNGGIAGRFKFIENGLPDSISASFYDGSQKVLATTLDEGESKTLTLYLSLPSQALGFEAEKSISFTVFALDENQLAEYENGASLDNIGTWSLDLSVTPVGAPVLSLSLDNRFARTQAGTEINITGEVTNTGSQAAEDVAVAISGLPYGWSAFADPDTISSIDSGDGADVSITIVLSSDASPGRYDLSISATSGDETASEDFEVRVETAGGSPILWIFALIFVFVILAGVMVKFGRR
jgi:hypothetical protein